MSHLIHPSGLAAEIINDYIIILIHVQIINSKLILFSRWVAKANNM